MNVGAVDATRVRGSNLPTATERLPVPACFPRHRTETNTTPQATHNKQVIALMIRRNAFVDSCSTCVAVRLYRLCSMLALRQWLALPKAKHKLEQHRIYESEEVHSQDVQPVPHTKTMLHSFMPSSAHLQEQLGIVCDDSIESLLYIPPHAPCIIDSPRIHRPPIALCFPDEGLAPRRHQHGLVHVERHIGYCEEVRCNKH